jgi:hypothetical protein
VLHEQGLGGEARREGAVACVADDSFGWRVLGVRHKEILPQGLVFGILG